MRNSFTEHTLHIATKHVQFLPFDVDYKQLNNYLYYTQFIQKVEQDIDKLNLEMSQLKNQRSANEEITTDNQELLSLQSSINTLSLQLEDLQRHRDDAAAYFVQASHQLFQKNEAFTCSAWMRELYHQYIHSGAFIKQPPYSFLDYVVDQNKAYLPAQYFLPSIEFARESMCQFPGSIEGRVANFNAHVEKHPHPSCGGRLISAAAPQLISNANSLGRSSTFKYRGSSSNLNPQEIAALDNFYTVLTTYDVKHIVVLGESAKRLNYLSATTSQFTATYLDDNLHLDRFDGTAHNLKITKISVQDNHSLCLTNETLAELLNVYASYETETVLVHCDSGVGRTGQLKLLFAMLNEYKVDPALQASIKTVIQASLAIAEGQTPPIRGNLAAEKSYISNQMIRNIRRLRQTRYSVQSSAQFEQAFFPLLLLVASYLKYSPQSLDKLRTVLDTSAGKPSIDFSEITDTFEQLEGSSSFGSDSDESQVAASQPSHVVSSAHPFSTFGRNQRRFAAQSVDETESRSSSDADLSIDMNV